MLQRHEQTMSRQQQEHFKGENLANKGLDDDIKNCLDCGGHYFVSEVHSCVSYLTLLLKEIVGQTAFDAAKARMRNDSVYEASKVHLDQSHITDTGSKLDVILNKLKLR